MILILTNAEDRSADLVEGELRRTGTNFLRLNTERFGTDSQIDFRVRHSSPEVIFKTPSINVPGEQISSIWNRRLSAPIPPEQIVNKEAREFAACELGSLLNGALLTLNCVWVSHPSAIRTSSYKINQLNAAADEGFRFARDLCLHGHLM